MFTNNPYAQAGWTNSENPLSIEAHRGSTSIRYPTLGPIQDHHRQRRPVSVLTFEFVFKKSSILESVVYGPQRAEYFHISTISGKTTFIRPSGTFATIDWNNGPCIEATGIIPRMYAGKLLPLSIDLRRRLFSVEENNFFWEPKPDATYLYHIDTQVTPLEIGRLEIAPDGRRAILQISMETFVHGIVQHAIISAVLLYSGIKFD